MTRFALINFNPIIVILALATALTSATANLANGVAFATASTALLASQYITGFMVLVAIVAGIGAANFLAYRRAAKQRQWMGQQPLPGIQHSFRQEQPTAGYLPDPNARLPSLDLPVARNVRAKEAEDTLFKDWGW